MSIRCLYDIYIYIPPPPPRTLRPLLTDCTTYRTYMMNWSILSKTVTFIPLKERVVSTHKLSCPARPPSPPPFLPPPPSNPVPF